MTMPPKIPKSPAQPAVRSPKLNKEVSAMGWIEDAFGKVLMVKHILLIQKQYQKMIFMDIWIKIHVRIS